jgi:hypothetical protein
VTVLADRLGVEMPIATMVDRIRNHDTVADRKFTGSLALPFGAES